MKLSKAITFSLPLITATCLVEVASVYSAPGMPWRATPSSDVRTIVYPERIDVRIAVSAVEGELIRAVVPEGPEIPENTMWAVVDRYTCAGRIWLETDVVYSELLLTLASNYLSLICGLRSDRVEKLQSSSQHSSLFYRV